MDMTKSKNENHGWSGLLAPSCSTAGRIHLLPRHQAPLIGTVRPSGVVPATNGTECVVCRGEPRQESTQQLQDAQPPEEHARVRREDFKGVQ
ncbi:unnamed protein product [Caenorhabditis brenneri]